MMHLGRIVLTFYFFLLLHIFSTHPYPQDNGDNGDSGQSVGESDIISNDVIEAETTSEPLIPTEPPESSCNVVGLVACFTGTMDEWMFHLWHFKENIITMNQTGCALHRLMRFCANYPSCTMAEILNTSRIITEMLLHRRGSSFLNFYFFTLYACTEKGQVIINNHRDCLMRHKINEKAMSLSRFMEDTIICKSAGRSATECRMDDEPLDWESPNWYCDFLKKYADQIYTVAKDECTNAPGFLMCRGISDRFKNLYPEQLQNCNVPCAIEPAADTTSSNFIGDNGDGGQSVSESDTISNDVIEAEATTEPLFPTQPPESSCNFLGLTKCFTETLDDWMFRLWYSKKNIITMNQTGCALQRLMYFCVNYPSCTVTEILNTSRVITEMMLHRRGAESFLKSYYFTLYSCTDKGQVIINDHRDCLTRYKINEKTMSISSFMEDTITCKSAGRSATECRMDDELLDWESPDWYCDFLKKYADEIYTVAKDECTPAPGFLMCRGINDTFLSLYPEQLQNCHVPCAKEPFAETTFSDQDENGPGGGTTRLKFNFYHFAVFLYVLVILNSIA